MILTGVFLLGFVGGVLLSLTAPSEFSERIISLSAEFLAKRSERGFSETLAVNFFSAIVTIIVLFLLGFGGIYQPISVIIIAFRGLGIGTALTFIYAAELTISNLLTAVSVLPFIVFSSFIAILACRESIRMSTSILRVSIAAPGDYSPVNYSLYIDKFIIMMFATGVVSVIDAVINLGV
jgi:hypothetical protein